MPRPRSRDLTYWRVPQLEHLELLRATHGRRESSRHTHEGYEISVIERGAMRLRVGGATYVAGPGTVVVLHPDQAHTEGNATDEGWSLRSIYPTVDNLHEAVSGYPLLGAAGMVDFDAPVLIDRDVATSIVRLHRLLEGPHEPIERESLALSAARLLVTRHGRPVSVRTERVHHAALRRSLDLLHDRYHARLSLAELAVEAGVTPAHLCRLFTSHLGMPPHEYLTQLRLRRAKRLLARPGQQTSLSAVAHAVGFVDQSHFTRHFRRSFGLTPGQFARGSRTYNIGSHPQG